MLVINTYYCILCRRRDTGTPDRSSRLMFSLSKPLFLVMQSWRYGAIIYGITLADWRCVAQLL